MTLTPGTRLGVYEVTAQLGAGGMGEVYRATDSTLKRQVAIKILPSSLSADPVRLARFQREAEVLASLNHPNIAAIYGLQDAQGVKALVMELVEGSTLADRIAQGPIPIDEALPIAKQSAEALEAAHEQGIIHRDLKPANIKVRPDGAVKVLDFGLAKALEPTSALGIDATASPTITSPAMMTGVGVLLGTAAYMSPEQARARPVDKRADIWAFGCVLFEMLTGRRPFDGEDVAETVGAIIHKQPEWKLLPPSTPATVLKLLQRCLEKDPKQRLRDIGDVRLELENAIRGPADAAVRDGKLRVSRSSPALAGWLFALALGLVAAAIGFVHFSEPPRDVPTSVRFEIGPPDGTTVVSAENISPDGRLIAFRAGDNRGIGTLWVRPLDSLDARPLAGTDGIVAQAFFWSPDSRFIGYAASDRTLKKINVHGGPPQTLTKLEGSYQGGAWSSEGVVIFSIFGQGLLQVPDEGGTPSVLTTVDRSRETSHEDPEFLPDGRRFLFTRRTPSLEETGIYVGALGVGNESGNSQRVLLAAWSPRFAASLNSTAGYLMFRRGGTLMAQPFDARRTALSGDAVALAESLPEVRPSGYSVSTTGVLTLRNAGARSPTRLVWFDRQGTRLGEVGSPALYSDVNLAPDGNTVVVTQRERPTDTPHSWVVDVHRQVPSRLNPGNEPDAVPTFSHDGRVVFYAGAAGDLFMRSASGAGDAELLLKTDGRKYPGDWSADSRFIVYDELHPSRRFDLWVVPVTGDRNPIPFLVTPANESLAKFSPDDRWVVYQSDESGRLEVYVRDFAPERNPAVGSQRIKISQAGGRAPRWRADGSEIYYIAPGGKMMAVPVKLGATLQPGNAIPLFDTRAAATLPYDVTADGRFLINTVSDEDSPGSSPTITVVVNWQAALNQ